MENLENLKKLAREAAPSDFLWELGMRAPSAHQVREFCKKWSIPLADEKRIKAVRRLREDNPDALREIRDDAAGEGDETMVEVRWGPHHYVLEMEKKDNELFRKLIRDLGLPNEADIRIRLEEIEQVHDEDLLNHFFVSILSGSKTGLIVEVPREIPHIHRRSVREVIRMIPDGTSTFARLASYGSAIFSRDLTSNSRSKEYKWSEAIISVSDKRFLTLAKRLGHAYEAETARRRKPAKAVVLKNY